MKFSKVILVCGAALLASCGHHKYLYDKGDPADDQKMLFLGQEIDPNRDGGVNDQVRKLISSLDGVRGINDGSTGLLLRAFAKGGFDQETNLDVLFAQKSDIRCEQAKKDKIRWHKRNGGTLPLSFGKITHIDIKQFEGGPKWAGHIDLCTWIKSGNTYDEYLFHLDFNGELGANTLQSHTKDVTATIPFPGTLEPSADVDTAGIIAMMSQWDYKLHAKKEGVEISTVWFNGDLLPKSDSAYNNQYECFDMFLSAAGHAGLVSTGDLPSQNGYCMGRCDARILNTK